MNYEVIATILTVSGVVLVATYANRMEYFPVAAHAFRNAVLDELAGIYPVSGTWSQADYLRINNSVSLINRAARDFMAHIPFHRKRAFKRAVSEYCEKAEAATFENAVHDVVFPEKTSATQKEALVSCINRLLTFAKT